MIDDQRQHLLLGTKLEPPPLPAGAVERPRVVEALAAVDAPYVQLVAGPGYGKSLAARQAVDAVGLPCAWVSLDPIDDTMAGFWAYAIEALRRTDGTGAEASEMHAEGAPVDAFLTALLRDLEAGGEPVALVLDDLHTIRSPEVLASLALFVERMPPPVRVLATSRTDPALPFARWRLSGRAGEVRQDVLRFSHEETQGLVATMDDLELDPAAVATLVDRTEGWAAGIQLSLLSLRGRPDSAEYLRTAFPPDRMVADYLVTEVLDRLPDLDRQLLLDLSVLEDFDGPLAAHVSGQPDAGERIRSLESGGVLLLPVDEGRARLRFHALLGELLRQELRWRQPARVPELHRRGAEYLAQHGHPRQAVHHLIEGGLLEQAFDLVTAAAVDAMDRSDGTLTRSWLAQVPTAFVADDPERMISYAVLLSSAGDMDGAFGWMDRADEREAEMSPRTRSVALGVRMIGSIWRGDLDDAVAVHQRFAAAHGAAPYTAPILDRVPPNLVRLAMYRGEADEAERWLEAMDALAANDAIDLLRVSLPAELALARGDLLEAETTAREALALARERGIEAFNGTAEAMAVVAAALFERGELAEADTFNRSAAEVFTARGIMYLEARQRVLGAHIAAARFGPASALDVLAASRHALKGRYRGRDVDALLDTTEAELRMALGEGDAASALVTDLPATPRTALVRARALARAGRTADAAAALDDLRTWPIPVRLDGLLLLATIRRGDQGAELIREASGLGVPRGYIRPFLAPGPELLRLLRATHRSQPSPDLEVVLQRADADEPTRAPVATFGTALTEREQDLLRLLPTHLTYKEMADKLCISVNTVKTNQKALYRKLQVATRSDAVEAGRSAGYIRA